VVRISCTSYRGRVTATLGIAVTESQVSFSGCFQLFQSAVKTSSYSKDLNLFRQHVFTVAGHFKFMAKLINCILLEKR